MYVWSTPVATASRDNPSQALIANIVTDTYAIGTLLYWMTQAPARQNCARTWRLGAKWLHQSTLSGRAGNGPAHDIVSIAPYSWRRDDDAGVQKRRQKRAEPALRVGAPQRRRQRLARARRRYAHVLPRASTTQVWQAELCVKEEEGLARQALAFLGALYQVKPLARRTTGWVCPDTGYTHPFQA